MSHLVFLLLPLFPSFLHASSNNFGQEYLTCSKIASDLMGTIVTTRTLQITSEEMRLWRDDVHGRCIDYMDCLVGLLEGNSSDLVTKTAADKQLKDWETKCSTLEFMTGKFSQCYDSITFSNDNLLKPILKSKNTRNCKFSPREMNRLKSIIGKKCGIFAVKDMKMNEETAKEMMCGFSVSTMIFKKPVVTKTTQKPIVVKIEADSETLEPETVMDVFKMANDFLRAVNFIVPPLM